MNMTLIAKLSAAAALLAASFNGQAACTATPKIYSLGFNSSSVTVPRNAPPATVITNLLSINETNFTARCQPGTHYLMFRYGNTMLPITGAGIPSGVYETGVNGIGIQVWNDYHSMIFAKDILQSWHTSYATSIGGASIVSTYMQLIVTGPITPGTTTFQQSFIEAWIGHTENATEGAAKYADININNIDVKIASCTTPNVHVDLGKHKKSEFTGLNSTSAATAFNFEILNCDPGMNSVSYTFKPAAGVTLVGANTNAHQHLTLDSSSTATGVGVQVLYSDNTRVKFNEKIKYTGYNKTSAGSYFIPMKARYIQTASTVTGGEANSALEFTMTYE